jgi:tRNA pseudouridine synthase 10
MDEVLTAARAVDWSRLGERALCDACLGRLFGKIGHGHTNEARGAAIRAALRLPEGSCWVCETVTSRYDALADLVVRKIDPWTPDTFLIGSKIDPEVAAREESLWSDLAVGNPEPLKAEVNREVGKRVEALRPWTADLLRPNLVAIVDPAFDHVDLEVNPLYLRGRYRKLVRGVPQTRWPCARCRGKGCPRCGGTGKMYATSVEEVIAGEVMRATGGTGHALHGMGREDIDARMLGPGRPFIVEIKEPRARHVDLPSVVDRINASGIVEVDGLELATGEDVAAVKEDRAAKTYRILIRTSPPVEGAKVKSTLSVLVAQPIAQRTPERVVHRRADTTRHRRLLAADVVRVEGGVVEIRVTAEAGTYVKEWVHGDGGRTVPSLAERLGVVCEVLELDVLDVLDG